MILQRANAKSTCKSKSIKAIAKSLYYIQTEIIKYFIINIIKISIKDKIFSTTKYQNNY